MRADGTLRNVLGDFGAVVLAYECPAHRSSIAPQPGRRHRQLSGSKLTTMSVANLNLKAPNIDAVRALRESGYALLSPQQLQKACAVQLTGLDPLRTSWENLPRDAYLLDGGRYRFRRHSCFVHELQGDSLRLVPHRAHWQPRDYNALHGGLERWFEPIETAERSDMPHPRMRAAPPATHGRF